MVPPIGIERSSWKIEPERLESTRAAPPSVLETVTPIGIERSSWKLEPERLETTRAAGALHLDPGNLAHRQLRQRRHFALLLLESSLYKNGNGQMDGWIKVSD